jgi:hypothetical protein
MTQQELLEIVKESAIGAVSERPSSVRWWRRSVTAPVALAVLGAIAIGGDVWSLTRVDPTRIGEAGLVGALPVSYFLALALAVASFALAIRLPRLLGPLMIWQVVVLIVVLHGADPIVHQLPRLEASYRHLGIINYIDTTGQINPKLDAYFNWPGFFGLMAMVSGATGMHQLVGLATWAPLGVNLLLLAPLLALAARITADRRHAWTGVWLFYLADWIGQDYLAPQAYGIVLLVTLCAVVLSAFGGWVGTPRRALLTRWVRFVDRHSADRHGSRDGPFRQQPRPRQAVGLIVVAVVLLIAMTTAHQLTPFAAILLLCALTAVGGSRLRWLPVLAVLVPTGWLVLVATPYLSGHLGHLVSSVGNIATTTSAAVGNRVAGSQAHQLVVSMRLVEAGAVWALAVAGAVICWRRRKPWLVAAIGFLSPLVLLGAQPYGGEMLLRCYLFGLPFAACLVALAAFRGQPGRPGWPTTLAVFVIGLALAGATVVTRYGNDAMETFSQSELALAGKLYQVAPIGSIVVEAVHNTAWQYEHYADYHYVALLDAKARPDATPLACAHVDEFARRRPVWVLVTQSQAEAADLLGIGPAGDVAGFVAGCRNSPGWTVVAANDGGTLFQVRYVAPKPLPRPSSPKKPTAPPKSTSKVPNKTPSTGTKVAHNATGH